MAIGGIAKLERVRPLDWDEFWLWGGGRRGVELGLELDEMV